MKKLILALLVTASCTLQLKAQTTNLPASIYSGKQGGLHVQGVVVDKTNGFVYFSFTDKLLKMDLSGKLIGSVTGFLGHLGDLDLGDDGKVYGSLEYKNDAIGKGIQKELGGEKANEDGFYIAVFDVSKIVRPEMQAEKEDLLRTVYIKEATADYNATVKMGEKTLPHRFACSGIDGLAFAPAFGSKSDSEKFLYIAYGVYGDVTRTDNDYQVLLKYSMADLGKYAQKHTQAALHHSGPARPMDKYFVKTGNTRYGIQNLAYDAFTGHLFAAVYKGAKKEYPNYDLFVIDTSKKPVTGTIVSDNKTLKVKMLSLLDAGPRDVNTGIRGWKFPYGATGIFPLGDGTFYLSHNDKSADGQQQTTVYKYNWVGNEENSFVLVK